MFSELHIIVEPEENCLVESKFGYVSGDVV